MTYESPTDIHLLSPDGKIHVTDRQTFRQCRQQWHYQTQRNLIPKNGAIALMFGIAMHAVLAEFYRSDNMDLASLLEVWTRESMNPELNIDFEHFQLGHAMLITYYQATMEGPKIDRDWEIIDVERQLEAVIDLPTGPVTVTGTIDLLIWDRSRGSRWIVDHKTYKSFVSPVELEMDDQMTAYLWLARENGIDVKGAVLNQLLKKSPDSPKLTQAGKISRSEGTMTTTPKLLEFIQAYGLKESDYTDLLSVDRSEKFIKREYIQRSEKSLDTYTHHQHIELQQMINPSIFPNFTRDCGWCSMKSLCQAQVEQGDVESIVRELYRPGIPRRS